MINPSKQDPFASRAGAGTNTGDRSSGTTVQLAFPFSSIDFEGFTILTVDQIALKLRYTSQHILNLVEQGALVAIDGKSVGVTRRNCRIPLEAYRAWVLKNLTGEHRADFIATLPRSVREALIAELKESLK